MPKPIGPKQGKTGAALFSEDDCSRLDGKNQAARESFIDKANDELADTSDKTAAEVANWTESRGKAQRGGLTISSSVRKPVAGRSKTMLGASDKLVNLNLPGDKATGTTSAQGRGTPKGETPADGAGVLCDESYLHPAVMGCGYHAEAKIVNTMSNMSSMDMRGGSMLFKIDWKRNLNRGGRTGIGTSGMPCRNCYAMLCHAAQECDIHVVICDGDNQPQDLSDCGDKKKGYEKLKSKVNGNDKRGRSRSNHDETWDAPARKRRKLT